MYESYYFYPDNSNTTKTFKTLQDAIDAAPLPYTIVFGLNSDGKGIPVYPAQIKG